MDVFIYGGGLDRLSRRLPLVKRLIFRDSNVDISPPLQDMVCPMRIDMQMCALENITWIKFSMGLGPVNDQTFYLHVHQVSLDRTAEQDLGLADPDGAYFDFVYLDYEGDDDEYDYVDTYFALSRIGEVERINKGAFYHHAVQENEYFCMILFASLLKASLYSIYLT